jgi:hypothetical protein
MTEADAARAAFVAFQRASLSEGISYDVALDVALARYRAFIPDAAESVIRKQLATMLAANRLEHKPQ